VATRTRTTSDDTSPICLLGGGGHALVVAEAARLRGQEIIGFYDDSTSGSLLHYVARWLGRLDDATSHEQSFAMILAIGNMQVRKRIQQEAGLQYARVIHPTSVISAKSFVGDGSFVGAGAVLNCNAEVGQHAIVNTRAVIEHDCKISVNVHVGPGAVLGGGVQIGSDTLVGINATIKPAITIGANCIVGAGAVVVNDVSDNEIVVGVPAKPVKRDEFVRRRRSA